jgi:succinate dehydrogenase flavin-adding protein (antitoxin of CptAB toxin-antitoxin module)
MDHIIDRFADREFFNLEHSIKGLLETDHVIHNAINKTTKVLVNKHQSTKMSGLTTNTQ